MMIIIDNSKPCAGFSTLEAVSLSSNGKKEIVAKHVAVENFLWVYVGDRKAMKFVCSPGHLGELVLGYFYSEGLIDSSDEIACIEVGNDEHRADIKFRKDMGYPRMKHVLNITCAKRLLIDHLEIAGELQSLKSHAWQHGEVFALADQFYHSKENNDAHEHSAHSCLLSVNGTIRYFCEDIGRHNALDKAIGMALKDQVDFEDIVVYTSGRVSIEIVTKVIRSRIPVLVSKTLPSEEAVKLATKYNLTLICLAKPQNILVFTDGSQIKEYGYDDQGSICLNRNNIAG